MLKDHSVKVQNYPKEIKEDINGYNTNHYSKGLATSIDPTSLVLREIDYKLEAILKNLVCLTDNYLHLPLQECFNWDEVSKQLSIEDEGDWFIVVFRSTRNDQADWEKLYKADALAHEEAKESGGLLRYWYGDLNEHRECLAMCIWANRSFARLATHKPLHIKAMQLASVMYDSYTLERYNLTKVNGESKLRIEKL